MLKQKSAAAIGEHNYTYWADKPVTPGVCATYVLVPQSVADGWEIQCSCGEFRAFANFYEIEGKDELLAALKQARADHMAETLAPTP